MYKDEIAGSTFDKIRILLIEDNPGDVRLIQEMLAEYQNSSFTIAPVDRLTTGLEQLVTEGISLVLLDLSLPDSQGIKSVRKIREQAPNMPVVVLTGLNNEEVALKAVQEGAQDYLVKGRVDSELLMRSIRYGIERKNAEQAQKENEKKYRLVVDNAREAIVVAQDGVLKFFNPKAVQLFGYSENEIRSMPLSEFIHPEDKEMVLTYHNRRLKGEDLPELYQFRVINKDGSIKWVEINGVLIQWEGKPATLNFLNDITYRRKAEEERIRLETAIHQSAEGIVITDADITIQYVNPAFEQITGYTREELIGQNNAIVQSVKHNQKYFKTIWTTLSSGEVWSGRLTNKKKDGSLYTVDATVSPVKNTEDEITNFVSVERDVTEEIEKDKQLRQAQKMEAIGTLAGGIAHDFNNILSAVMGYTELAMDKAANDDSFKDNLQEVLTAAHRAKDLVSQILTFSRQAEQQLQPVQVKLIAKEALKLLRASIPSTIQIRHNIQSDDNVLADPTQIHQILMNLCANANHAMGDKGGVLEVSLTKEVVDAKFASNHKDITPGAYLKLTVSDTGCGISHRVKEKIFDPFFTTKKKDEGTGLGLSVVHGIVKTHGGAITVSSTIDKGSTFNVYLPIVNQQEESKTTISSPLPTGNESILFVDDEKTLVDIGLKMLDRHGYKVTTRTSSVEALELFKTRADSFDLVVTDMTMPNMTGEELSKELHYIRPNIPVVLCTGFSLMITEKRAQAAGIRGLVKKPIIMAELVTTVRKVLDRTKLNNGS